MIRLLLGLVLAFGFLPAFADQDIESTITYITGYGSDSGFCDGNSGSYFCVDQIKRRAQQDATRDAEWTCQMRQGTAEYFSAMCSDSWSPNYIPPDSGQQYVSCRSNCSIRCIIPSRSIEIQE